MKYDTQLNEVQRLLPTSPNILIALPRNITVDNLAAGLALHLALQQSGKRLSTVSEGVIRVGHTNLFGVGDVRSSLPQSGTGNFVISLGNVVGPDGKPYSEKMDYFVQGSDLNLVFYMAPGQKFEPTHVTPRYDGGGFELTFVIGAASLADLGTIYTANPQAFFASQLVNIDNKTNNTQFGRTNIIDFAAASLSEMIIQVILGLGLRLDSDIASNVITGIFDATSSLQASNVTADTFEMVSLAIRNGGQKPGSQPSQAQTTSFFTQPAPQPVQTQGFNINQFTSQPQIAQFENFLNTQAKSGLAPASRNYQPTTPQPETSPSVATTFQSSPEEVPMSEAVVTPEADWLTPKVYSSKNIG